jgi:hypothetical protein
MDEPKLTKICNACKQVLGLEMFSKNKAVKDGYENKCRDCMKIKQKQQYDKHAEKRRIAKREKNKDPEYRARKSEYNKEYRVEHRDELNEYTRQWRKDNPDYVRPNAEEARRRHRASWSEKYHNDPEFRAHVLAKQKDRRDNETDEQKQKKNETHSKWRAVNIDHARNYACNYTKHRRRTDPVFQEKEKITRAVRRYEKGNDYAYEKTIDGAHFAHLHAWQNNRCFYCNAPMGKGSTTEHIIPRSLGGHHTAQNVVLACRECNCHSKFDYLYKVEWKPKIIHEIPFQESFLLPKSLKKVLESEGFPVSIDRNSVIIGGKTEKRLIVLSSFVIGDRVEQTPNYYLPVKLTQDDPDAIVLYDFEWYERRNNVINMLKAKVGLSDRAFARKMTLEQIAASEARVFLDTWHVMGFNKGTHYIAMRDSAGELMGCAVFNKIKENLYDNVRLAFSGHVSGGMSRMIAYFRSIVGNVDIMSYVDSRYADGSGHASIGFEEGEMTLPSYRWVFPDKTRHRATLSTKADIDRNLIMVDSALSLEDNIAMNGVFKVCTAPLHKILLKASC